MIMSVLVALQNLEAMYVHVILFTILNVTKDMKS